MANLFKKDWLGSLLAEPAMFELGENNINNITVSGGWWDKIKKKILMMR